MVAELSGGAGDVDLDATQIHHVTSYERVCKMPLLGIETGILTGFPCKTGAVWIDLRRRVAEVRSLDVVIKDVH